MLDLAISAIKRAQRRLLAVTRPGSMTAAGAAILDFTRSMRIAAADLRLHRLDVVHAGAHTFPLHKDIRTLALSRVLQDLDVLG